MAQNRNERRHLRRLGAELRQEHYEAYLTENGLENLALPRGQRPGRKLREGEVSA